MQAQPAALAACAACGIPVGSGASYNEQALLWKVIRFEWAVTAMRRTPPGGPARFQARLSHTRGAGILWEVGTSYNERRLPWGVVRLV